MLENQPKTLSFKTNEEVSGLFDKLEARIKEVDPTLTRGDVLATVVQAAEKTLVTEDNIKLATREELRLIDQHTQRLKEIYLSIFKRSEDHQLISTNKIKELESSLEEIEIVLKEERNNFKENLELYELEKEELEKENEEIKEKSRVIENSFLDKERTIKNLEEKIKELEEVMLENRELSKENKELIALNNQAKNDIMKLEGRIGNLKDNNERLEESLSQRDQEIKGLNTSIQEIINEKEREKAKEIKDLNDEYKVEIQDLNERYLKQLDEVNLKHFKIIDELKESNNNKIQELNNEMVSLKIELDTLRSR